jgi:O-antigen ligase
VTTLSHGVSARFPAASAGWTGVLGGTDRAARLQIVAGVAVALGYLVATALSIDAAVLALGAAAVVLALVWPAAGLAVLALILPMREPSDAFRPLYIDATIIGAASLGCLLRLAADRRPAHIHPGIILAAGYAFYTAVSVLPFVSGYPAEWVPTAGLQTIRIFSAVGIFLVASCVFRSLSPMPFIVIALAGAFITAVLALLAFNGLGPVWALEGLLSPSEGNRANGGFSNANYLGFFMAQSTLLALGCWSLAKVRYRPLLTIVVGILVAALLVTYSRNAYLGASVGVIVLVFLRSPRAAMLLVLVGIAAAVVLYPSFQGARVGQSDLLEPKAIVQQAQSENWRRLAAAAGISIFLAEPVFGVGYGVFHHLSPAYIGASPATYSHNAFIQILAEQGIVGSLMVAGIICTLAVALFRSKSPLRAAAIAMGCAYLLQSFFINSTQSIQISGLLLLTLAATLTAGDRLPPARVEEA